MAPIRVGIIGLSSRTSAHEAGGWCSVAHMPFLQNSPLYNIVAITGKSIASAKKAVTVHKLPDTTRLYTTAEDIAADPDIDLILVALRVEKHFANAMPVIQAGKDIFLEMPFCANTTQAEELTKLAAAKGIRTITGLGARADWLTHKVKQIIADGTIGKVICSTLSANSGLLPSAMWAEDVKFYLDMSSGSNDYYNYFTHYVDTFTFVLGDFEKVQGTMKVQLPSVALYNGEGKLVDPSYTKTAPDHVLVQGVLSNGAVGSLVLRKVADPVDGLGLRWLITGTKGEIEITSPPQHFVVAPPGRTLRLRIGKGEVQNIDFQGPAGIIDPEWDHNSHNASLLYDAFARGNASRYATFESALKTRRLMDEIVKQSEFKF